RARELLKLAYSRKTAQPLAGGDPPFACTVLEGDLVPAPAEFGNLFRKSGANGCELPAVKLIDKMFAVAADHIYLSCPILKDGINSVSAQAVGLGIGREAAADHLHRAAAVSANPEIAIAVLGQRLDIVTAETIRGRIGANLLAICAGQEDKLTCPAISADP